MLGFQSPVSGESDDSIVLDRVLAVLVKLRGTTWFDIVVARRTVLDLSMLGLRLLWLS